MAALLVLGASSFAEIVLKDLGGGKVAITFLFEHHASEMGVIGSFDNWTVPGEAMSKNANGLYEYTMEALATDEIQYKFYTKGVWIYDENAPDKKDDGYGGNNGLIVVADILSGVTPMKPGAAPVIADASASSLPTRQKVQFGTETYLDSTTVLRTVSGDEEFVKADLNAKSVWKFDGDLVPNLPGHIEITAMDGQTSVMTEADSDAAFKGFETMATGFIFNPLYYMGGNERPSLAKLSFGIDGSWLEWETGYMDSTLPTHDSVLWTTVRDDYAAGEGYSQFRLGKAFRSIGPVTVDAAAMPNKSIDGYFGYLYWARASAFGITGEFQYDFRSLEKTDSSLYFDTAMRQDYIAGLEAKKGNLVARGQYLLSRFAPGGEIDTSESSKRSAYEAQAGYENGYSGDKALASYAYRGDYAQMLFADNDDVLGAPMTQKIAFEGLYALTWAYTLGLEAEAVMAASDNEDENVAITAKPSAVVDLGKLGVFPAVVSAYASPFYNTDPAEGVDGMGVSAFGARVEYERYNVYYKFDNGTDGYAFNTVLADMAVAEGFVVQAGAGVRLGSAAETAAAFALGTYKALDIPQAKSPTVYAQFLYNMDPYNGTAAYDFDLSDYGPASGPAALDGLANVRFGIGWNY